MQYLICKFAYTILTLQSLCVPFNQSRSQPPPPPFDICLPIKFNLSFIRPGGRVREAGSGGDWWGHRHCKASPRRKMHAQVIACCRAHSTFNNTGKNASHCSALRYNFLHHLWWRAPCKFLGMTECQACQWWQRRPLSHPPPPPPHAPPCTVVRLNLDLPG